LIRRSRSMGVPYTHIYREIEAGKTKGAHCKYASWRWAVTFHGIIFNESSRGDNH
jgi:hypothetical protein